MHRQSEPRAGLEDAEGPGADADDPTAAINAANASAPGTAPSDACRYQAAYTAGADGFQPPGNQGAGAARLTHHRKPRRSPSPPHTQPKRSAWQHAYTIT